MTDNINSPKRSWLDRPILQDAPFLTVEWVIFSLIVILMITSRLYDLGGRVFSHDESLHAFYSWLYAIGQGYQHNPTTHGPLQFHLIALTFLLFGDSDFTARLPAALASIATVVLLWKWRRYLGRAGTLVAAGLMLISPFMLYYGRYVRNEAFVALLGVLTLYAILRYLETGKNRFLVLLSIASALHFTVKETAFIYTAQALLFLGLYLFIRVTHSPWKKGSYQNGLIMGLLTGLLLLGALAGLAAYNRSQPLSGYPSASTALLILACLAFLGAAVSTWLGYGWKSLRGERAFSMMILLGTFVLPQLAALPVKVLGWNPLEYQFTWPGWDLQALWAQVPVRTAAILLILVVLSLVIGLLWDARRWALNAAFFWSIYIIFYTSLFSNWAGLATGLVGSLGYWLVQQGVQRGNQPWYYYLLIQIPLYEFLPAAGVVLAGYLGLRRKSTSAFTLPQETSLQGVPSDNTQPVLPFQLLSWWFLTSLVAFSLAGEKMPWLTVHIALPMILLSGWGLGQVIERMDWSRFNRKGSWAAVLLTAGLLALIGLLLLLLGTHPPFQGKTLEQLSATGGFFFFLGVFLACAIGLFIVMSGWQKRDMLRLTVLVFFGLLAVQTARTAVRAAYLHPDDATEYLVYAHGASGIQDVMNQLNTISYRTSGWQSLSLAIDSGSPDAGVAWPFNWYLRHYSNKTSFDKPSASLQGEPVILVDQADSAQVDSLVGNDYYHINYIRMVWPNQDYFNLTWRRIQGALTSSAMRSALWKIWFDRDYSQYAEATGSTSLTLPTWSPSDRMVLLIRKDVAAEIWGYDILQKANTKVDPYQEGKLVLSSDLTVGGTGVGQAEFSSPHGIAAAPDGSFYVADTNNNRIQHISADGSYIDSWGTFADVTAGNAPVGTFNQPWAVAVSPDGKFVYVADTWNHRIQKFTADGTPVKMWGKAIYDPTNTDPYGMWGPRGIAVDPQGRVFVADTGNKRILEYDADGNFLTQIGNEGLEAGQFEEPVGLAIGGDGYLYVADTWNQRVQVFSPKSDGSGYSPSGQWTISGWYGESLDNKPYLTLDNQGHVFATDPESFRVLEFTTGGDFVRYWGDYGSDAASLDLPSGIAVAPDGRVWVSDSANDRLLRFSLP